MSSISLDTKNTNQISAFQQEGRNYLGKIVAWLRGPEDRALIAKVFIYALTFIISGLLFATVVGIPIVLLGFKENTRQQEEESILPVIRNLETKVRTVQAASDQTTEALRNRDDEINRIRIRYVKIENELADAKDKVEQGVIREGRLSEDNATLTKNFDKEKEASKGYRKELTDLRQKSTDLRSDLLEIKKKSKALLTKYNGLTAENKKLVKDLEKQQKEIEQLQSQLTRTGRLFQGIEVVLQENPQLRAAVAVLKNTERPPISIKVTPELQAVLNGLFYINNFGSPTSSLALPSSEPQEPRVVELNDDETKKETPKVPLELPDVFS